MEAFQTAQGFIACSHKCQWSSHKCQSSCQSSSHARLFAYVADPTRHRCVRTCSRAAEASTRPRPCRPDQECRHTAPGTPARRTRSPGSSTARAIALASGQTAPYMTFVALLFESGPYFVSLQASNPVPYPIAAVRPITRVRAVELRQWSILCL
jgi:hypothetical protein